MITNKYPNLTSPIKLGHLYFRNRIFSAPMGATDITPDCYPGPRTQGFYELLAKGGAAFVSVSAPFVHEDGDCVCPANITKAVYEGYHAALDI